MVTRETSIAAGLSALGVLQGLDDPSRAIQRAERFAALLVDEAIPRGLLGAGEEARVVSRHLLESAALATTIEPTGRLVDVGSGAGLPGVVLAILWRGGETILIEPQARRCGFLRRVVSELALPMCAVEQSSAEKAGRSALRESADVVVARAVAPPAVALELTVPLARVGGSVALPVGEGAAGDGAESSAGPEGGRPLQALGQVAELLGGGPPEVRRFEVPGVRGARWVMLVRKLRSTPDRYPRRPGVPRRRPLGGGVA